MSWGEHPSDFTGEPRKVFINFLIWNLKQIEEILYFTRRTSLAIRPLMGLVDSLDSKSKKALKNQYQKLQAMREGTVAVSRENIDEIYRNVLTHLHENYLQEVGIAFPRRPSKDRMGLPPNG